MNVQRHLDQSKLFLVSTLLLFFELALIRYLGSEIPAVGFFKNLILIAAFFGMGLGLVSTIPVRLSFILFAATSLLPHILITVVGAAGLDQLAFAGFQDDAVLLQKSHVAQGIALVVASFLSAMIPLIFLGRLLGHYFEAVGKPLRAYGWNLLGSLVGTLLFSLICRASMSPIVWFSICASIFCIVLVLEWNNLGPRRGLQRRWQVPVLPERPGLQPGLLRFRIQLHLQQRHARLRRGTRP